ncbi:MAG: type II toxin-antitoxin system VapB family antitoxin [Candidatus Acidiferrales bacterium]
MPTNLAIDDRLLQEAQKVGRHRTKRETVTAALEEYIGHRKQQEILSLFGKIDYERDYDYKRERKAKRT